jgi:hypothetical protein
MKLLKLLFSFEGELDRRIYLLTALPVFFLQHAFVLLCIGPSPRAEKLDLASFLFNPMRATLAANEWTALAAVALALAVTWILMALSIRRVRRDGADFALTIPMIMPMLQLPMIILLSLVPKTIGGVAQTTVIDGHPPRKRGAVTLPAMQGALAGGAICLAACAFGTLVFGSYGYALFLATPVVVGITAAYLANRKDNIGAARTGYVVAASLMLGAIGIMGVAIEGAICLAMASPIIGVLGWIGGLIGRAAAENRRGKATTLSSIAILPMLFIVEGALPPKATFVSVESIEVAAGADEVWHSITHMSEISEPPSAPFGWGLAYPISGEIQGEGVGAVRKGVFSTGIAYEQVTVWKPGRELTFDVLSDPPALKELSPYDHVQAPHLAGYFTTAYAKFTLKPLGRGRTRLTLETQHSLDLEPAIYWIPLAQWAIHENKVRVLAHFARQAEGH